MNLFLDELARVVDHSHRESFDNDFLVGEVEIWLSELYLLLWDRLLDLLHQQTSLVVVRRLDILLAGLLCCLLGLRNGILGAFLLLYDERPQCVNRLLVGSELVEKFRGFLGPLLILKVLLLK